MESINKLDISEHWKYIGQQGKRWYLKRTGQPIELSSLDWSQMNHRQHSKIGTHMNRRKPHGGRYTGGYVAPNTEIGQNRYGGLIQQVLSEINPDNFKNVADLRRNVVQKLRELYPKDDYMGFNEDIASKTVDKLVGVNIKKALEIVRKDTTGIEFERDYDEKQHKRDGDGKYATQGSKKTNSKVDEEKRKKWLSGDWYEVSVDDMKSYATRYDSNTQFKSTHSLFLMPDGTLYGDESEDGAWGGHDTILGKLMGLTDEEIPSELAMDWMGENDIVRVFIGEGAISAEHPYADKLGENKRPNEAQSRTILEMLKNNDFTDIEAPHLSQMVIDRFTNKGSATIDKAQLGTFGTILAGILMGLGGYATIKTIKSVMGKNGYSPNWVSAALGGVIGGGLLVGGTKKIISLRKGVTFITVKKSNTDMDTYTIPRYASEEGFSGGHEVITTNGDQGIIVAVQGQYVDIRDKAGKFKHVHVNDLIKSDEAIPTEEGITRWGLMTSIAKKDLLKSKNIPTTLADVHWSRLDKSIKQMILKTEDKKADEDDEELVLEDKGHSEGCGCTDCMKNKKKSLVEEDIGSVDDIIKSVSQELLDYITKRGFSGGGAKRAASKRWGVSPASSGKLSQAKQYQRENTQIKRQKKQYTRPTMTPANLDDLKRISQPIINTVPDKKKRFGGVKTLTDTDSSGKERKYHYARQYTTRAVPSGRKNVIGDKQGGTTLRLKENIIMQGQIDKPCRHCLGRMGKPFDDYKKNRITMTCTNPSCKATGTVYIKHGKPARPYTPSDDRMIIEGPRGGTKKVVNPDAICHGCGTNKIGVHSSPDKSKCRECNVWRSEGGTFKHKALDDLMEKIVKSVSTESITPKKTKPSRSEHKSIPETKTKPEALTTTGF